MGVRQWEGETRYESLLRQAGDAWREIPLGCALNMAMERAAEDDVNVFDAYQREMADFVEEWIYEHENDDPDERY